MLLCASKINFRSHVEKHLNPGRKGDNSNLENRFFLKKLWIKDNYIEQKQQLVYSCLLSDRDLPLCVAIFFLLY